MKYARGHHPNSRKGGFKKGNKYRVGIRVSEEVKEKLRKIPRIYTGETKNCTMCHGKIYVAPHLAKRKKFCSKICFYKGRDLKQTFPSGELHPAYKNGESKSGYTREFKPSLKTKIRKRDGFECQLCGINEKEYIARYGRVLCVNHIDFDKKNCSEINLNTLCIGCNARINWDRDFWTRYFQREMRRRFDG